MIHFIRNKFNGLREIMKFDNRLHIIVSRLSRQPLTIYRLRDICFIEEHTAGDANGARHLLTSDMYRVYLKRMRLPSNPTIVDLGASNGGFILLLKALDISPGHITAVEMNPHTFVRMQFNIEYNFSCSLRLLNAAVSDSEGIATIRLGRGSTGDSLFNAERDEGNFVEVPTLTLNKIIDDLTVHILKMDIEGAEHLLVGSKEANAIRQCAYVLVEIHSDYGDTLKFFGFMNEMGFTAMPSVETHDEVFCFVNTSVVG
jgi:FkbM family methyltransferase